MIKTFIKLSPLASHEAFAQFSVWRQEIVELIVSKPEAHVTEAVAPYVEFEPSSSEIVPKSILGKLPQSIRR